MRVAILVLFLVSGCSIGSDDMRIMMLEKRVEALEKANESKVADDGRLDKCLSSADDDYWSYVKLNGARKGSDGVWRGLRAVFDSAEKSKANAIEICKATYR